MAILYFAARGGRFLIPGFVLVVVGELLRIHGVRHAGARTRTRNVGARTLCTSGPFAHVRNPLYLANMMIYSGIVFMADGPHVWEMLGVSTLFFGLQYGLIISLEEKTLRELFGGRYTEYAGAVPRMIPRLTPWRGATQTHPSPWPETLKSERRTMQTLAAFLMLLAARIYLFP